MIPKQCKLLYDARKQVRMFRNVSTIDDAPLGMVENGVPCGDGAFCIEGACEDVAGFYDDSVHCGEHGTPNHHGGCTCKCGHTGMDCSELSWCHEAFLLSMYIILALVILIVLVTVGIYILCVVKYNKPELENNTVFNNYFYHMYPSMG